MAIVAIDHGIDHHAESEAKWSKINSWRKEHGMPAFTWSSIRYIEGWLMDTESGKTWFCVCPYPGSPEHIALKDCWWNRNAVGREVPMRGNI